MNLFSEDRLPPWMVNHTFQRSAGVFRRSRKKLKTGSRECAETFQRKIRELKKTNGMVMEMKKNKKLAVLSQKRVLKKIRGFSSVSGRRELLPLLVGGTLSNMKTRGISHNSIFCDRIPYVP